MKHRKRELLQMLDTLEKVNQIVKNADLKVLQSMVGTLEDCQNAAIAVGTSLEEQGEHTASIVAILEEYCESIYQQSIHIHEVDLCRKIAKKIQKQLNQVRNAIQYELPEDKKEIVFLPYKAAMWDSLESVWLAAKEDENCDTYVVPIPYFDKNSDGSLGAMHYEGEQYPEYVPITSWQEYLIDERRPDVIYIHNPYDNYNSVTSVHPAFYSKELKKYTDQLIYIPYYSTSGGMSEGQRLCPAYLYADYIVTQAEKYRDYFDESIPDEKFLPFGSPKFDRVIKKCEEPVKVSEEWNQQIKGKTVYFYNTSIGGMLNNTASFLEKMEYVFRCFQGRTDACLLWRPHPLLESTFDSMRAEYKPVYEKLKRYFIENHLGIYDTTPDITDTIALCDAYIGDAGTSITSLFGITGKPLFILNNLIHREPLDDDWKGGVILWFNAYGDNQWFITQGNKLYYSKNNDYHYQYYCDLSEYSQGGYYSKVWKVEEKVYVCPASAQDILRIGENGIEEKIYLQRKTEKACAFYDSVCYEQYLLLIPYHYPAVVRYDTSSGEITYFTEHLDVFRQYENGQLKVGGVCVHNGYLLIASPVDARIYSLHIASGEVTIRSTGATHNCGGVLMESHGEDVWILPYTGKIITRWNFDTGIVTEYSDLPEGFVCTNPMYQYTCEERPFLNMEFEDDTDTVYFSRSWGNMYLKLDCKTGKIVEWIPPFQVEEKDQGYYLANGESYFLHQQGNHKTHCLYSARDRKLYEIDFKNESCEEIPVVFDVDELKMHESGFGKFDEWLQYGCNENCFNSLPDFLNGNITGGQFDKEAQKQAYEEIAANYDGSCGRHVHEFVMKKVK